MKMFFFDQFNQSGDSIKVKCYEFENRAMSNLLDAETTIGSPYILPESCSKCSDVSLVYNPFIVEVQM